MDHVLGKCMMTVRAKCEGFKGLKVFRAGSTMKTLRRLHLFTCTGRGGDCSGYDVRGTTF